MINNNKILDFTPLEFAVINSFARIFSGLKFPSPSDIKIINREEGPFFRFLYIHSICNVDLDDGFYGFGDHSHVNVDSLQFGMVVSLFVSNSFLEVIEFTTNGEAWDGCEDGFTLIA